MMNRGGGPVPQGAVEQSLAGTLSAASTLKPPPYPYKVHQLAQGEAMAMPAAVSRSYVGLGWRGAGGKTIDLDASCIAYSGGQVAGAVSFQELQFGGPPMSTMVHSGDVLVG